VDDAEDGDILVHEYGHAVQYEIVPGIGQGRDNLDARAIGEGWSDIQAYAIPTGASKAPVVPRACIGAWDALGYEPPAPCLRRVDGHKHYPEHLRLPRQPHFDGEIWSGALHEIFEATGLGPVAGYRLVLESMYDYSSDVTFLNAAEALLEADEALHGGAHVAAIRRVLLWRGLLATISEPAPVDEARLEQVAVRHESPRPLDNSADDHLVIRHPGATAVRVRFAELDLETGEHCVGRLCDAVYVYSEAGDLYARLGGVGKDVLSPIVPGEAVIVRWVTNGERPSTGLIIDRLDVLLEPIATPDAGPAPLPDARPPRPGTGDAQGSCATGGGAGGAAAWVLLVLGLVSAGSRAARRGRARRGRPRS
jgi:hypothetical protein